MASNDMKCKNCKVIKEYNSFVEFKGNISKYCLECLFESQEKVLPRKKYILYMHPTPESTQYSSLSEYWEKSRKITESGIQNEAVKYPFHITLTGFFETSDPYSIINRIGEFSQNVIHEKRPVTTLKLATTYDTSHKTGLMYVGITAPKISKFLGWLKREFPFISTPSQQSLHLTLFNRVKRQDIHRFKEEMNILPLEDWTDDWCFALWEFDAEKDILKKKKIICNI